MPPPPHADGVTNPEQHLRTQHSRREAGSQSHGTPPESAGPPRDVTRARCPAGDRSKEELLAFGGGRSHVSSQLTRRTDRRRTGSVSRRSPWPRWRRRPPTRRCDRHAGRRRADVVAPMIDAFGTTLTGVTQTRQRRHVGRLERHGRDRQQRRLHHHRVGVALRPLTARRPCRHRRHADARPTPTATTAEPATRPTAAGRSRMRTGRTLAQHGAPCTIESAATGTGQGPWDFAADDDEPVRRHPG